MGCVAGALEDVEYRDKLAAAGFEQIDIEPTRVYRAEDARDILQPKALTWTLLLQRWTASS